MWLMVLEVSVHSQQAETQKEQGRHNCSGGNLLISQWLGITEIRGEVEREIVSFESCFPVFSGFSEVPHPIVSC